MNKLFNKIKIIALYWAVITISILVISCEEEVAGNFGSSKSPERAILSVTLFNKSASDTLYSNITNVLHTDTIHRAIGDTDSSYVIMQVLSNSDLSTVYPKITASTGATISPANYEKIDISKGYATFTVTAEDGKQRLWKVKVSKSIIPDSIRTKYSGKYKLAKNGWFDNWSGTVVPLEYDADDTLYIYKDGSFYIDAGADGKHLTASPTNYEWADVIPKKGNWIYSRGTSIANLYSTTEIDAIEDKITFLKYGSSEYLSFIKVKFLTNEKGSYGGLTPLALWSYKSGKLPMYKWLKIGDVEK